MLHILSLKHMRVGLLKLCLLISHVLDMAGATKVDDLCLKGVCSCVDKHFLHYCRPAV